MADLSSSSSVIQRRLGLPMPRPMPPLIRGLVAPIPCASRLSHRTTCVLVGGAARRWPVRTDSQGRVPCWPPPPRPCRPGAPQPLLAGRPAEPLPSRCDAAHHGCHGGHDPLEPKVEDNLFTSLPLVINPSPFNRSNSVSFRFNCVSFVTSRSTQYC
jgi:hypothetical protein